VFLLQKNTGVKSFFPSVPKIPRVRMSEGNTATCGTHAVQSHALQVIEDTLNSLCARCRDAHALPVKCIPDRLD